MARRKAKGPITPSEAPPPTGAPIVQVCPFCVTPSMSAKPYQSQRGRGYTLQCIRCQIRMFIHIFEHPVGLLGYRRLQRMLQDPRGQAAFIQALQSYEGPVVNDASLPGDDVVERLDRRGELGIAETVLNS